MAVMDPYRRFAAALVLGVPVLGAAIVATALARDSYATRVRPKPKQLVWPAVDPPPEQRFWEVYHESTYRMRVKGGWLYTVWLPGVHDKPPALTFIPDRGAGDPNE